MVTGRPNPFERYRLSEALCWQATLMRQGKSGLPQFPARWERSE
jgi:hypothetical protein